MSQDVIPLGRHQSLQAKAKKSVTLGLKLLFETSWMPSKAIQKIRGKSQSSYHSFSNRFKSNIQMVCIFLTSPMCYKIMEIRVIFPSDYNRSEISESVGGKVLFTKFGRKLSRSTIGNNRNRHHRFLVVLNRHITDEHKYYGIQFSWSD